MLVESTPIKKVEKLVRKSFNAYLYCILNFKALSIITIEVNARTKAGKALLEVAKLLASSGKGVFINKQPDLTSKQEAEIFFANSKRSMSGIISKYL